MSEPGRALQGLLSRELRAAVTASIEDGADPRQVTVDLENRLWRIGDLRRAAATRGQPPLPELHRERGRQALLHPAATVPGGLALADHTILWLCPFGQGIDPPEALRPNVSTIAKHSDHAVSDWLDTVGDLVVDAIIIDVSVVRGHNYDPGVITDLLVERCARPPRYVVAVVKRGGDDPISSQYAFAHEVHLLWGGSPRLVIEESVLYYLEAAPETAKIPTAGVLIAEKHNQVGQIRRWGEIAARGAAFVTGEMIPEPVDRSHQAVALVRSMCDRRRGAAHFRLSPAQRSVLIALADSRPDVQELVRTTGYSLAAVRSALRSIANGLNLEPANSAMRIRQDRAMSFCDGLAKLYAPWLRSLARRR